MLAREVQIDRWATLIDVAPFPDDVADDVFTSPYYERLEAALARHEAAGHLATVALNMLAPRLTPGDEQTDPAAQLAALLDQATGQLAPGRNRRRRVAGLIATVAQPIPGDMQTALDERQALIETAARRLVGEAQDAEAAWISRLRTPPAQPRARAQWRAQAATIALYRYRYEITGPSPLGDAKAVLTADQAAEYRAAQVALRGAQRANRDLGQVQDRVARRPDPQLRL